MKKIFAIAAMLLTMFTANAQVSLNGTTFTVKGSSKVKGDTIVTKYDYTDSKGILHKIILNKANGACYVWKTSGKSGKMYKQWFTADNNIDISKQVAAAYGVPFTYTRKPKK